MVHTLYLVDSYYLTRGERFLRRECCRYESTIVAALLGGNQTHRESGSQYPQRSPH